MTPPAEPDRDALRNELDDLVPTGWWHTTNELRSTSGRAHVRTLLETLRFPDETRTELMLAGPFREGS